MPFDIGSLGMQAAGAGVGTILGLALEGHNDRRQLEQQGKLQAQQIQGQKEMGEFNLQQQLKLWEATNYSAQIEQMRKAGISPGLIYGMKGGGGTTAATQPGQVSGGIAANQSGEALASAGMGMQLGMMQAQRQLIEAQTENVKADTAKKTGIETRKGEAEIQSIGADIDNKIIQGRILKLEEQLQTAATKIAEGTIEEHIRIISQTAAKLDAEVTMAEAQNFIDQATKEAKVAKIVTDAVTATVQQQLLRSNIEVNAAEIRKMVADVAQGWENLSQKGQQIQIQQFAENLKAKFPTISQTLGRAFNDGIESIFKLLNKPREPHNQMNQ